MPHWVRESGWRARLRCLSFPGFRSRLRRRGSRDSEHARKGLRSKSLSSHLQRPTLKCHLLRERRCSVLCAHSSQQVSNRCRESGSTVATPSPITRHRADHASKRDHRSEEHTSELQSLMRISYAVFCLTKKKTTNTHNHNKQPT